MPRGGKENYINTRGLYARKAKIDREIRALKARIRLLEQEKVRLFQQIERAERGP